MRHKNEGEEYINAFPKLKKWMNECICCHTKGYNPAMPEKITVVEGSLEVYNIKRFFKPLYVNEYGLCGICAKVLENKNKM